MEGIRKTRILIQNICITIQIIDITMKKSDIELVQQ